jgi:hypothetical protein
MLLICATLASAIHPDAAFAAGHSAMDCCAGIGGAMKDSCPFMRLKATRQKKAAQSAQSDPMCHAGMAMPSSGEALHGLGALTELYPASATGADETEHAPAQNVSTQNTTAHARVSPIAADSKPCASDCCCQTNSLTRTERTRDDATASNKLRPRPPTSNIVQRTSRLVPKNDSKARRQCSPRAPPASL